MKKFLGSIAGLGLLALASPVQAIPTLDTLTTWNGITTIGSFGEPNTATYGQTFTVMGPETHLDSFTFLINDLENPDVIDFQEFVYAWDGTRITGPALFSSSNLSTAADADVNVFETHNKYRRHCTE